MEYVYSTGEPIQIGDMVTHNISGELYRIAEPGEDGWLPLHEGPILIGKGVAFKLNHYRAGRITKCNPA